MKVKVTFMEELLGTACNNPEVHEEFIASRSADAEKMKEELAALPADELVEKGMTIFPRDEQGNPFLFDYQLKGFFKDSCSALGRVETSESKKLKAYKKIIDGLIFVKPRKILLQLPAGGAIGNCQRPLRAQTAQGERIALANSETVPTGTSFEMEVLMMDPGLENAMMEWLNYGEFRGLGQWRNSGKGRFTYELLDKPCKKK